jgi:DNA-binding Lrp family transcriptional regulator
MPTPKLTDEECLRAVEALRTYHTQSAASRHIGMSRSGFQKRLNDAVDRGFISAEEAIGNSPKTAYATVRQAAERRLEEERTPPPQPVDPVEVRRLKDAVEAMKKQRDEAVRRAIAAEDLRSGVLGLGEPKRSSLLPVKSDPEKKGRRTVLLHLSDVHYGEVVDLAEMDGVNAYSPAIAERRISLLFDKVCRLLTEHWKGKPPEKLILELGGDLISGALHPELARTDAMSRLPSCRDVASLIAQGILQIRKRVGCLVDVHSVPGNHGRLSIKPESKGAAIDSFDTLVAWFVERDVKHDKGVSIYYSDSIDALFPVYGRMILLTHGDRVGSRGGTGFVGVAAPIARGHQKLAADYAHRGIILYRIHTAHLHTSLSLTLGDSNGSVIGWNQYARDLRARAEPASQNMSVIHSEGGLIDWRKIMLGSPDEGSIYRGAP